MRHAVQVILKFPNMKTRTGLPAVKVEVRADRTSSPYFAVHKKVGGIKSPTPLYTVTHIPTGYCVRHFARVKQARVAAAVLASLPVRWSTRSVKKLVPQIDAALTPEVRDWIRSLTA